MNKHEIPSGVSNPTTSLSDIPDFMKGATDPSSEAQPARGRGVDPAVAKRRLMVVCAIAAAIVAAVVVTCMNGSKGRDADAEAEVPAAQAPADAGTAE